MSKTIELAKKLKALADRGVGGEKDNAQAQLNKLMAKHKLNLEDIEDDVEKLRNFTVLPNQRKFFKQVVSSVLGRYFKIYSHKNEENIAVVNVNNCDYIEIDVKFNFYWQVYQGEQALFWRAFVNKNRLFIKGSEAEPPKKYMSEKEAADLMRMWTMAEGIETRIPSGNANKSGNNNNISSTKWLGE